VASIQEKELDDKMILGKIWGTTEPLLITPAVEIHRIMVHKGYKCSEHIHQYKWNAFYCIGGRITICVRKNDYDLVDRTTLEAGDFTTVAPNEYHWFETDGHWAHALEIYYPQHITEDIVRKSVGASIEFR